MPLFGESRKNEKSTRKARLNRAFDIQLTPTARDKAAAAKEAAKDKIIATVAREKKKQEARDQAVAAAEALKERALARKEAAAKKPPQKKQRATQEKMACTCRKPTLGRDGKCRRCHNLPASRRRK